MKRKKVNQREKQSSTKKKKAMMMSESAVIDLVLDLDSPLDKNNGSPLRSVLCVKSDLNMREIEEREDCFILDFDLDRCGDDNVVNKGFDDDDVSVIREKGKVACRDYPHSRHLCVKNHFEKTPHQSYCELCYCFVCDTAAPCTFWAGKTGHCHAIDNEAWKSLRKSMRNPKK